MAVKLKKEEKVEPLSGTENQCEATFTFNIGLPDRPYITFRCMREKHEDGKHEHCGISEKGWDYRVCWDEPKVAIIAEVQPLFTGKESKTVQ